MSNILHCTLPANTQLSDKVLIMHFCLDRGLQQFSAWLSV